MGNNIEEIKLRIEELKSRIESEPDKEKNLIKLIQHYQMKKVILYNNLNRTGGYSLIPAIIYLYYKKSYGITSDFATYLMALGLIVLIFLYINHQFKITKINKESMVYSNQLKMLREAQ